MLHFKGHEQIYGRDAGILCHCCDPVVHVALHNRGLFMARNFRSSLADHDLLGILGHSRNSQASLWLTPVAAVLQQGPKCIPSLELSRFGPCFP